MCHYTTLWKSSVLKANWKQDDFCDNTLTNWQQETTCLVSQLLSEVTVTSCSFYIKMFNVSTLLLDDTLKPATPLTNGVINETLQRFAPLGDISQGSVATHLRCGGIFNDDIIANFNLILTVKEFRKSVWYLIKLKRTKHGIVPIFRPPCTLTQATVESSWSTIWLIMLSTEKYCPLPYSLASCVFANSVHKSQKCPWLKS